MHSNANYLSPVRLPSLRGVAVFFLGGLLIGLRSAYSQENADNERGNPWQLFLAFSGGGGLLVVFSFELRELYFP